MAQYPNYVNLRDVFEQNHDKLRRDSLQVSKVKGLITEISLAPCLLMRLEKSCFRQAAKCVCALALAAMTWLLIRP